MLKKIKLLLMSLMIVSGAFCNYAIAEDDFIDDEEVVEMEEMEEPEYIEEEVLPTESNEIDEQEEIADQVSVNALNDYQVEGSLFEKITMLEQDKVVLQLEKERAQLDLELERLNAERMKLQMELDTLSGRAEHQQQELEVARAQLEAQAEQLKRQKENLDSQPVAPVSRPVQAPQKQEYSSLSAKYKLVNIGGVGNQLQATIQEISSGQNKRIFVGKELDGYIIKSISLNDGIVFEKDGKSENLNIGK